MEAEIVQPKAEREIIIKKSVETETADSAASDKNSDFKEEDLTMEEAEKAREEAEKEREEAEKERIHPLDYFSEEEINRFMDMSNDELEEELRKEESKEEGAYRHTKRALQDEVLERRQEEIDS